MKRILGFDGWFRQARRALTVAAAVAALAGATIAVADTATPAVLHLGALQYGTVHWELEHLQRRGLDRANGFELRVRLLADLPASRLALASGSVDGAVGDLLWAQARHEAGSTYAYLPFSSQIGDLLVPLASDIQGLADLRGKRIGVAGGPDGQGWLLLQQAARAQGLDLTDAAEVQFAAPPLLEQALRRGQLDAVLTFWQFAARMQAAGGVRSALRVESLLGELGLEGDVPVLGYLFPRDWAARNADLLARFARAVRTAKHELATDPAAWTPLRPLMRADSEALFDALRAGYLAGTPAPLDAARIANLQRFLRLTGADPSRLLPAEAFVREQP